MTKEGVDSILEDMDQGLKWAQNNPGKIESAVKKAKRGHRKKHPKDPYVPLRCVRTEIRMITFDDPENNMAPFNFAQSASAVYRKVHGLNLTEKYGFKFPADDLLDIKPRMDIATLYIDMGAGIGIFDDFAHKCLQMPRFTRYLKRNKENIHLGSMDYNAERGPVDGVIVDGKPFIVKSTQSPDEIPIALRLSGRLGPIVYDYSDPEKAQVFVEEPLTGTRMDQIEERREVGRRIGTYLARLHNEGIAYSINTVHSLGDHIGKHLITRPSIEDTKMFDFGGAKITDNFHPDIQSAQKYLCKRFGKDSKAHKAFERTYEQFRN